MSAIWIVLLGLVIVGAAGAFALFVGVGEAGDPDVVASGQRVPRWERKLVSMRRKRTKQ